MRVRLIVALAAFGLTSPFAVAEAKSCGRHSAGTAHFDQIRVEKVSCGSAKSLLARTTRAENRQGSDYWNYAGRSWSIQSKNEFSNIIRGRDGDRRIRAIWSAT